MMSVFIQPLLPLKEIVIRRIAVILWKDTEILTLIEKIDFYSLYPSWDEKEWRVAIENKVQLMVSKLPLPDSLMTQIMHIVRPIGIQIVRWKVFHKEYLIGSLENLDIHILKQLRWTSAGAIDYRKTAEELVCSVMLDVVRRYRLACLYCLEDYIAVLWKELPEVNKKNVDNRWRLERFWTCILNGEESERPFMPGGRPPVDATSPPHCAAFVHSAYEGNKAATEYFFQKLTSEERATYLFSTVSDLVSNSSVYFYICPDDFPKETLSNVFCYLFSKMTSEQQIQIFQRHPGQVLNYFLNWPWLDLFLDIVELLWPIITERDYDSVIHQVYLRYVYKDYDISKLFQKLFMNSPSEFKKQFLIEAYCGSFFPDILKAEDTETIKVIFRNLDVADRFRLVSCDSVLRLFYLLILKDSWQLVKLCLQEATLLKEDKIKLKDGFMKYIKLAGDKSKLTSVKWELFCQSLDLA